jgi:uncharacterized membrane protein
VPPKAGEPSGGNHAFLWQNGVMRDLGLAPGTDARSPEQPGQSTVNDRGTVLVGDWMNDAWFWRDGRLDATAHARSGRHQPLRAP